MTSVPSVEWCCVAAVNRPDILAQTLAASPALAADPARLTVMADQPSAAIAYNRGLDATQADYVVFAHQDVYLPQGWDQTLARVIADLEATDPNWAVAGLIGRTPEGDVRGRVWSTGLVREVGEPADAPVPAVCVDELLIILKRSSGLRFDPDLPSFHLYGTDIVLSARKAGQGAYIVHAPVVHHSQPVTTLMTGFDVSYAYLQQKLAADLPVQTLIVPIEPTGADLRATEAELAGAHLRRTVKRLWNMFRTNWRWPMQRPTAQAIAHHLGYEGPRP